MVRRDLARGPNWEAVVNIVGGVCSGPWYVKCDYADDTGRSQSRDAKCQIIAVLDKESAQEARDQHTLIL